MGSEMFNRPVGQLETPDMSGWVNVEMPEDEADRVGTKGAEYVAEIADSGHSGNERLKLAAGASTIERLYAVAIRETDQAASADVLRKTLNVSAKDEKTDEFKKLDASRFAACNAMRDLDSLTGREIARVNSVGSGGDAKTELARAVVRDAVKAQETYAQAIREFAGGLPADDPRREGLSQLAARAEKRAKAIEDLWQQLQKANDVANGADGSEYDRLLLGRRGFSDQIFLDEAKEADLSDQHEGGRVRAEKFKELEEAYAKADGRQVQREVRAASARRILDGCELPAHALDLFDEFDRELRDENTGASMLAELSPELQQTALDPQKGFRAVAKGMRDAFAAYKGALSRLIDISLADGKPNSKALDKARIEFGGAIVTLRECQRKMRNLARDVSSTPARTARTVKPYIKKFDAFLEAKTDWEDRGGNIVQLCEDKADKEFVLDREDRMALIEGTRRLSTAVEAQVWGEDGLHDNDLDGLELAEVRELGSGAFNSVKLCTFANPDGTTVQRVFRPDAGSRRSIATGDINKFLFSGPDVSGFSYSHATGVVASIFDCADVFPKTTFGTLNGEPGMFLEVAPGKEGGFFRKHLSGSVPDNDPLKAQGDARVAADIARKLNRLQWLDVLTGQLDRHMDNVMVGKSGDGVSVKGIDNDMCFPDISLGGGLYVFNTKDEALTRMPVVKDMVGLQKEGEIDRLSADLSSKPQLNTCFGDQGAYKGCFVLDVNKLNADRKKEVIKLHNNFGFPDHIDRDLYDKLTSLTPEAYAQTLKNQTKLSPAQIDAAVARFCHVRDVISQISEDRIYDSAGWENAENLSRIADKPVDPNYVVEENSIDFRPSVEEITGDYYKRSRVHRYLGIGRGMGL